MHTVKTTITTSTTGAITGYCFCVEAETTGEGAEIAGAITASLELLCATITARFAPGDPPAGYAPAQPLPDQAPPPVHAPPPATPAEAEQRFFVRYSEIVGGQDWADVRRYLHRPSAAKPATVEQWIAAAAAVRDRSRAQATPA